ncbi:MAG: acyltransferase family protein [Pseudomonadota bacterium]
MSAPRYHAVDNLRTGMMFVVMFGHPLLPYVTVPRSFKDPSAHPAMDVVAVFLYAFAMQAFFVTAGFAAALILDRKGMRGLWQNRLTRIFVPLLGAYLILSPLTRGAYTFSKGVIAGDSLSAGLAAFATLEWLRWSKLYHLWFLLSLLLFTALAVAWVMLLRHAGIAIVVRQAAARWLAGWSGFLMLLALAAITTIPAYIDATGDGTHWAMQITLLGYFSLGWLMYLEQDLIRFWQTRWRLPAATALVSLPICVWASRVRLFNENDIDVPFGIVAGVSNAAIGLAMTVALIGWFHVHWERTTATSRLLNQASYWVYLIHYPVVIAAGGIVAIVTAPAVVKYLLTLVIAIPVIALTFTVLVLGTPLRGLLVGGPRRD